jgi:hypothetical protein
MLKWKSSGRLTALLLLVTVAGGCVTPKPVDTRPNREIGSTRQTVIVTNETNAPLTLLPPPDRTAASPVTLQPGSSHPLAFTLSLQQNASAGREREVILLQEISSPLLAQSSIDLVLLARFGGGEQRDLRIKTGECVFSQAAMGREHALRIRTPPLAGVPVLNLCSN